MSLWAWKADTLGVARAEEMRWEGRSGLGHGARQQASQGVELNSQSTGQVSENVTNLPFCKVLYDGEKTCKG